MKRRVNLFGIVVIVLSIAIILVSIYCARKVSAQDFVRHVVKSPSDYKVWIVTTGGNYVFALDLAPINSKLWESLDPIFPFHFWALLHKSVTKAVLSPLASSFVQTPTPSPF